MKKFIFIIIFLMCLCCCASVTVQATNPDCLGTVTTNGELLECAIKMAEALR